MPVPIQGEDKPRTNKIIPPAGALVVTCQDCERKGTFPPARGNQPVGHSPAGSLFVLGPPVLLAMEKRLDQPLPGVPLVQSEPHRHLGTPSVRQGCLKSSPLLGAELKWWREQLIFQGLGGDVTALLGTSSLLLQPSPALLPSNRASPATVSRTHVCRAQAGMATLMQGLVCPVSLKSSSEPHRRFPS